MRTYSSGIVLLCLLALTPSFSFGQEDPPEVTIGERLFLETRFAQHFAANSSGDANNVLTISDPSLATTKTVKGSLPGPFAGKSMNCRACHLVDEHQDTPNGENRTYGDFARRSPIPSRSDGKTETPRNSPPLVNASLGRKKGTFFHFDGEFITLKDLARATYTGRNFGWLPTEASQAVSHVAHTIRNDNGAGDLAEEFGSIPYATVLKGTDASIPKEYLLPQQFRIDVSKATDSEVLDAVDNLVAAYVKSLTFAQDENGAFSGSPYDSFLSYNNLPRSPRKGESDSAYSERLIKLINSLKNPKFVHPEKTGFELHNQNFRFGPTELQGLKIFFRQQKNRNITHGVGNCVSCHPAPAFTDFEFHNTGAAQDEYDSIHGTGAFLKLSIPTLSERNGDVGSFLPPTTQHPNASGKFLSIPNAQNPEATDLGLWNVLFNPDNPTPQRTLKRALCRSSKQCSKALLLRNSIAVFKTLGLRDLADSAPYLHTGQKDALADVIKFYVKSSKLARASKLRNGDPEISNIHLSDEDTTPLVSFLRSLNEDYN